MSLTFSPVADDTSKYLQFKKTFKNYTNTPLVKLTANIMLECTANVGRW